MQGKHEIMLAQPEQSRKLAASKYDFGSWLKSEIWFQHVRHQETMHGP